MNDVEQLKPPSSHAMWETFYHTKYIHIRVLLLF